MYKVGSCPTRKKSKNPKNRGTFGGCSTLHARISLREALGRPGRAQKAFFYIFFQNIANWPKICHDAMELALS